MKRDYTKPSANVILIDMVSVLTASVKTDSQVSVTSAQMWSRHQSFDDDND